MPTQAPSRDPLSLTFAALADPTRRAILARLVEGDAAVTTLAEPFEMTLPAISKHLKVLERAGLVERSRHAQWRPCRLSPAPLRDVAAWVEHYRQLWEHSFDRLEDYLREIQTAAAAERDTSERSQRRPARRQRDEGAAR